MVSTPSETNETEPSAQHMLTPPLWKLRTETNIWVSVQIQGASGRGLFAHQFSWSGTMLLGGKRVLNNTPPWAGLWYRPRMSCESVSWLRISSLTIAVFDVPSRMSAMRIVEIAKNSPFN